MGNDEEQIFNEIMVANNMSPSVYKSTPKLLRTNKIKSMLSKSTQHQDKT